LLPGDPHSFAAGGNDSHSRGLREDCFDQVGGGVKHMLAVVEHQQPQLPSSAAAIDSLTLFPGC
jgi:hypothetical protein